LTRAGRRSITGVHHRECIVVSDGPFLSARNTDQWCLQRTSSLPHDTSDRSMVLVVLLVQLALHTTELTPQLDQKSFFPTLGKRKAW
jgi:hypothetical protein